MSSQSQVASTQVTKRQTKPAEVRIDELMNAAQTLFLEKGVEATTISEIIASVGVAKGTFYHYFESKQHIVEALKKRYIDFFIAALDTAVATCDAEDWVSQFKVWISANIQTYLESYAIHDIVFGAHHHERKNNEKNMILEQLLQILNGGQQAGIWHLEQPRLTALLIYSGVHGVADEAIANQLQDSTDFSQQIAMQYLKMLHHDG
ncbi:MULTISPECIES: TetR/AcrR family transcriptional regulator [Acinetobacter]|uniref:TetR/AcrR family transcriptional regulator n=1 Tax=Acinetobacter TaxID=469 RepID=UPI00141BD1A8|nr:MULTISPECIES: TetR/AcrR family transcriptional regulator [Acinetobacter]MCS4299491.1 AcrR family transcriptional regulator [Acinetobacter guillouiae]MCW2252928.1 AcrR family transcriptional regulator [Acinetobacter sp. BIGb0204]NII36304.1 AcrR family transcriptional regulator [Acinetobacter sp. BIGb0196]